MPRWSFWTIASHSTFTHRCESGHLSSVGDWPLSERNGAVSSRSPSIPTDRVLHPVSPQPSRAPRHQGRRGARRWRARRPGGARSREACSLDQSADLAPDSANIIYFLVGPHPHSLMPLSTSANALVDRHGRRRSYLAYQTYPTYLASTYFLKLLKPTS